LIGRDQIGEALHPGGIAPIFKRVAQQWESPELLARLWSLLYKSCQQPEDSAIREKAYSALCRLTPLLALNLKP
jgi:hypothetical protein